MLKIIEQQNKLYEQQAAMMKNQLSIMERMVQAIEEFQPSEKRNDLEELNKTLTEMADNVEDVGEKSNLTQNDFNKLAETMLGQSNRVAGSIKKFGLIGMGLSPIVGVVQHSQICRECCWYSYWFYCRSSYIDYNVSIQDASRID